jgi:hypothetical protein
VDDALGDLSMDDRRRLTRLMTRVKSKLQALAERDPAANAMQLGADETDEDMEAQAL